MIVINGKECPHTEEALLLIHSPAPRGYRFWSDDNQDKYVDVLTEMRIRVERTMAGIGKDDDLKAITWLFRQYYL